MRRVSIEACASPQLFMDVETMNWPLVSKPWENVGVAKQKSQATHRELLYSVESAGMNSQF